jgi:hypothetical protein
MQWNESNCHVIMVTFSFFSSFHCHHRLLVVAAWVTHTHKMVINAIFIRLGKVDEQNSIRKEEKR